VASVVTAQSWLDVPLYMYMYCFVSGQFYNMFHIYFFLQKFLGGTIFVNPIFGGTRVPKG
jgi:hypothetical protein